MSSSVAGRIASFWGKARPVENADSAAHPLVAHALDVAAVAVLLPGEALALDGRTLGWLVALHDIGKFSRTFQAKEPRHWPASSLGPFDPAGLAGPRHDAMALTLFDAAKDLLMPVFPPRAGRCGWSDGERGQVLRALAGHHGRPVAKPESMTDADLGPACIDAARGFVQAMTAVFRPPALPIPPTPRELARLEWSLAGLVTLADWVGSRQAWFPYVPEAAVADPAAYLWTHALPRAAAALAAAGLLRAKPAPFRGLQALFPAIADASPVQRWAAEAPLPDGPVLAVIEDLTGSGKTEAAVVLTHRLLASGRARGVFLALPTMATANAMFDRMAIAYRRLFEDGADPSLVLAHGRAAVDARFAPSFAPSFDADAPAPGDQEGRRQDPADEPAESHCAAWLAEDRRRALLAEVGVGTIDQALLAVLPVRHAVLRQRGLRGKVLVIDEAHAFDPYMREEVTTLLQFHAAMGGSAILLSATLPHATRQRLVDAFRKGLGAKRALLQSSNYPLATLAGAAETVTEHPCAPRIGLPRRVTVTRAADVAGVLERVLDAARLGAAAAWVRNTVDDALAAAALLRAERLEPLVFHARFALCDRMRIEAEVLRRFRRNAGSAQRTGVLVATQVVESSLDLDFDLLCTDLAPVDSLIQRAGRLWRHERTRALAAPELVVLSPEPVADPQPGWIDGLLPGTAAVYRDPALLWRSARAIFDHGTLDTPGDMRPMIEAVAEGETPPSLAARSGHAIGKAAAAAGVARQNVLDFRRGYTPDSGAWAPDTHTPTRLEDVPHVTLRLARRAGSALMPYAPIEGAGLPADLRRAWTMSEVSVPEHRFATCPLPPEWQDAARVAKQAWGRWERESDRVILVPLEVTSGGGAFTLRGRARGERVVSARYTPQEGLRWEDSLE